MASLSNRWPMTAPQGSTDADPAPGPRVGYRTRWLTDERLRFMAQVGVSDVFVDAVAPGYEADAYPDDLTVEDAECVELAPGTVPSVEELRAVRDRLAAHDLRFAGIHSLHYGLYDDAMFGREGRGEQIETVATLLERLGEAGIDTLGYQWNPRGLVPMRTDDAARVRGGARATAWEAADLGDGGPGDSGGAETIETPPAELDRTYTEDECWTYYEHFLEAALPRAEAAGVRLALHPADPPVYEEIGGVPRLFRDVAGLERAMETVPSEAHGLKCCLGCLAEMGEDVPAAIRRLGEDLVFVHFRDVVGSVPSFTETFLDAGDTDVFAAMTALRDVGFGGPVLLDHVPEIEGDTAWRHRSRAYATGYLRCLIDATGRPSG
jgi:mannonate dehydratase